MAAKSQPLMRERKRLETLLADDAELARRQDDIEAYFELAKEGEAVEPELEREIPALVEFSEKLESKTMLSGETDPAECDCHGASGRGRDREPGLGRDADADVSALGGAAGVQDRRSTKFRMATRRGSSRPRLPSQASSRSGC